MRRARKGTSRTPIDAVKALLPVLQGELPEQAVRDFESVVANMQLAYVRAQGESEPTA